MTFEVRGEEDLGVAECDLVARGETPAEVIEQVVKHFHEEHFVDLPDPDVLLQDQVDRSGLPERKRLIVARLRETLGIGPVWPTEEGEPQFPPEDPESPSGPSVTRL